MSDIIKILEQELGTGAVMPGKDAAQRAVSFWDNSPVTAKALIRPHTTEEVSTILKLCSENGQSVITHGGNTTCVQGTTSSADNIIISLERMNKIVEIDPVGSTATLEAGVVLETAQNAMQEQNLFLPLDLGRARLLHNRRQSGHQCGRS